MGSQAGKPSREAQDAGSLCFTVIPHPGDNAGGKARNFEGARRPTGRLGSQAGKPRMRDHCVLQCSRILEAGSLCFTVIPHPGDNAGGKARNFKGPGNPMGSQAGKPSREAQDAGSLCFTVIPHPGGGITVFYSDPASWRQRWGQSS